MSPATVRVTQTTTTTSTTASVLLVNTGYLKTKLGILKLLILASERINVHSFIYTILTTITTTKTTTTTTILNLFFLSHKKHIINKLT